MNRRALLKGFAAGTAGLLVPAGIEENIVAARRYWSLDHDMFTGAGGVFRVSEYGRFWDADDSPAIARCIDRARRAGGGVVLFDRPLFHISQPIELLSRTMYQGNPEHWPVIRSDGAGHGLFVAPTTHDIGVSYLHLVDGGLVCG
jgi:hypothetical protein